MNTILRKTILALALLSLVLPSLARADWREFIPRSYKNGADLDVFGSYESDDNRVGNYGTKWTDTFLKEKVTLYSDGIVYDPKFIVYRLSLAGALKQEDYENVAFPTPGWVHDTGVEYTARVFVLPEHPYTLEVFATRFEPLYKQQSAVQHNTVETSRGVLFHYRRKPYFFHTDYVNSSIETDLYSTDTKMLGIGGEYFKQYSNEKKMSLTADFRPSTFTSSSSDLQGNSKDLSVAHTLDLWRASIHSSISHSTFNQKSSELISFESDNFTWFEQLRIFLPANFDSLVSYRLQNNSNENILTVTSLSAHTRDFLWEVNHHLYASLRSTYQFHYSSSNSSGGDSHATGNSLVLNYTKMIPGGNNLLAGFFIGRAVTNSAGQTSVLNDPYSAVSVPGSFVLRQENVDAQSIHVYVKNPLPPNEIVPLEEGIHYTLLPSGSSVEITVFTLPAQFPVPGTYDFLASYSLTSGDFRLATSTIGYNVAFNLWRNMLYPYYSYSVLNSDVLSGVFFGTPLDSKTTTVGTIFHRRSLRLLGEYQNLDWNISPRVVWRGQFDYVGSLSPTFTYRATLEYQHRHYSLGTLQSSTPYTEQITSASGSFSKELFARTLLFSAGGTYSRDRGLTDGNSYSVNSSLSWKVGKLDFTLGATAYHSDVEGDITTPTKRTHQYYYLNLKRKLF